jgi:hypothetical protein
MIVDRRIELAAALLLFTFAAHTLADDSPADQPVKSHRQKMHECIAQQRAANANMPQDELKKTCERLLQTQQNHPSVHGSPATP